MRAYRRFESSGQMAVSVAVFAALALVLESGGLNDWALRLELGPVRTVAVPVAGALHRCLGWTGMERLRGRELEQLARVGWSDDAAVVAASRMDGRPLAPPPAVGTPLGSPVTMSAVAESPTPPVTKPLPTPLLALQPMAGDPPLVSALPPLAGVQAGKLRTVALVGDSMMAVGLSSTILREAPQYKNLAFVKTYKSGTGLARPEVFDWQTEYPAMLKQTQGAGMTGSRPDVIVVAIGANDGQGFVEEGVTYPFGTAAWQALYERRVQAFLALLERDGARVVWIGLPPMKSGSYDARIAQVNRIDYAVVSASPGAIWFSSAGVVGDASGRFQEFGQVRGATARLRQLDGIHLSDEGASLLTAKLLPWLARQEAVPVVVQTGLKEAASADAVAIPTALKGEATKP